MLPHIIRLGYRHLRRCKSNRARRKKQGQVHLTHFTEPDLLILVPCVYPVFGLIVAGFIRNTVLKGSKGRFALIILGCMAGEAPRIDISAIMRIHAVVVPA